MARFATTSTPLGNAGVYNTGVLLSDVFDRITGSVTADQGGTLFIEQSADQTNWDVSTSYTVNAADAKGFSEELLLPYVRVRYVNGATPQATFRLTARCAAAGNKY